MAQTLATFTATMPATFATSPATLVATLAARYATPGIPGQHGGTHTTSHRDRATEQGPATDKATGQKGGGKLAAQAASHGARGNAAPYANKQGAQRTQSGGNIGTAPRVKAPYRCVKMANKAYRKKPPEYAGSKGKPRTACAMRGGGHFWSLARSKSRRIGCNRIYSKTKGGTSLKLRDKDAHIIVTDKLA